ncbi:glucosaminidase domain-containing protein [Candidatus Nomurabacteria bacterium]|uniref:Glucosaminidase domain-containing protein n=1 Tax=candidate division WWE3 bacterium TaxID=2053526 RepID=A0A955E124_UNCKA|nr:glucosaminidase domain-containing protein [candidate division WWE3 bacterium]MCB9823872.1 glucosaminidase domain-containing protein [Candidatus Nomurabacteria bacterium]MCB9827148.1 glucosaminidase domain-containing protein [Candidatus Nomurabacteria bacterium]MCB9827811.1 glucosaminidase domain-containing protein [Candidatus Nomurabacteria bacterium]
MNKNATKVKKNHKDKAANTNLSDVPIRGLGITTVWSKILKNLSHRGRFLLLVILWASMLVIEITTAKAQESVFEPFVEQPDHIIESVNISDIKRQNLQEFFAKYNSPLIDYVEVFIEVSEEYNMDYRLIPSIAGVESTFCKNIIPGSYNCYGWGIYGSNIRKFTSYEDGIRTVSKGLYEGYISKGADTPDKIEPIYTPSSNGHWKSGVKYFMNQMDSLAF